MPIISFDQFRALEPIVVDGTTLVPGMDDPEARFSAEVFSTAMPERGRPFVLNDDFELEDQLNAFVGFIRSDGLSQKTARHYATDLVLFARYLREQRGVTSLTAATSEDTRAYWGVRVEMPSDFSVSRASWCRTEAALTRFYAWAEEEGLLESQPPRTVFKAKPPAAEMTIKWIGASDYLRLRDLGLAGEQSGNGYGGRWPLRNKAFGETLVTTGSRLEECSVLLKGELPQSDSWAFRDRRLAEFRYPETITKFRVSRVVPYPRRVATDFVEVYEREERSLIVERWRRSGVAASRPDYIFGWKTADGRIVLKDRGGRALSKAQLTIDERRRLVLLASEGADLSTAEPAALWLNEMGGCLDPSGWETIFRRACLALAGDEFWATPHTLRHTFAVLWLSRLIKRNLSALKTDWASVKDDRANAVYSRITRNPVRRIQLWLGHRSVETTEKYLLFVEDVLDEVDDAARDLDELLGGDPR